MCNVSVICITEYNKFQIEMGKEEFNLSYGFHESVRPFFLQKHIIFICLNDGGAFSIQFIFMCVVFVVFLPQFVSIGYFRIVRAAF